MLLYFKMFNLLKKLRNKSEGTKKRVAFFGALVFSGIILVVWLSILYPQWRASQSNEAKVAKLAPGPLSSFSDSFFTTVESIKDKFSSLKEAASIFSGNSLHYSTTSDQYAAPAAASNEEISTTTDDYYTDRATTQQ